MSHILAVDDDPEIRTLLQRYLSEQGFDVSVAAEGQALRAALNQQTPDLVLLDVMMPGEDGLSLCRFIREHHPQLPVILVTARGEATETILGLEIGADDYVAKPFNPRELLARIKAVLRRASVAASALVTRSGAAEASSTLVPAQPIRSGRVCYHFAGWTLDTGTRDLIDPQGVELALSNAEYKLLKVLLHHPRRVLTRDQLLDLTAGREAQAFDRAIDNQISRLRRKIEEDTRQPRLIKTVWGGGYQLNAEVARSGEEAPL